MNEELRGRLSNEKEKSDLYICVTLRGGCFSFFPLLYEELQRETERMLLCMVEGVLDSIEGQVVSSWHYRNLRLAIFV